MTEEQKVLTAEDNDGWNLRKFLSGEDPDPSFIEPYQSVRELLAKVEVKFLSPDVLAVFYVLATEIERLKSGDKTSKTPAKKTKTPAKSSNGKPPASDDDDLLGFDN